MTARKKREEKNPTKVVKNKNKKTQSLRTDSFFIGGVSLTHPVMASFYVGSYSYTSGADVFMWKIFLTYVPCWLVHVGSLSYTSCAGCLMEGVYITHPVFGALKWRVSLTHPLLASLCGEFLLHILC